MKILVLATDAFGANGGIALYTREMLVALCQHPARPEVVAVPLASPPFTDPLPANLTYLVGADGSKPRFCARVVSLLARRGDFDLVISNHLSLLPLAELARRRTGAPILLFAYGWEVWTPSRRLASRLVPRIAAFVGIQPLTGEHLRSWADIPDIPGYVLPNPLHLERYGPGPKSAALVEKYGLNGARVIMTVGRLDAREPYKGFDEVLAVLPDLLHEMSDLRYVIVGEGADTARLQEKAAQLGVADRVVFTGFVDERDKVDHYRLADVFAMPGSGPTFDRYPLRFVFLEALACGIPVVASRPESREAEGDTLLPLIEVDPFDAESVKTGIRSGLSQPRGIVPAALEQYGFEAYTQRLHAIVDTVIAAAPASAGSGVGGLSGRGT